MSVSMAAQGATDSIEVVDLALVNDDPSWPTDAAKVEEFQAVIRRGKSFGTPVLWRTQDDQGRTRYEIIDGFHRFRALIAEGIKQYPAMVRTGTQREAEYDRIQASLDKPAPVLYERAVQAFQRAFVRDMANTLQGQPLLALQRVPGGTGDYWRADANSYDLKVVRRKGPFPADPWDAVLVLTNHLHAKALREWWEKRETDPYPLLDHVSETLSAWEQTYITWLDEMSAWFGWDKAQLVSMLGLHILNASLSADAPDSRTVWHNILTIGDEQIQRMLIRRVQREAPSDRDIELAGAYLDIFATDWRRQRHQLPSRTNREVISLLSAHTIQDLRRMQEIEEREYLKRVRETEERERQEARERAERAVDEFLAAHQADQADLNSAVFATASSGFLAPGTISPSLPVVESQPATLYTTCHQAAQQLLACWRMLDEAGGDWSREQIQEDFRLLSSWIESHAE